MRRATIFSGIRIWIVISPVLFLSGCINTYGGMAGADWPMPYSPTTNIESNGQGVAIRVEDQRPYIVSGDKAPTYIGNVRAGFGNPWDTTFEPPEPVAQKIRRDIVSEMSAQGYDVGQGDYTMGVVIREFKHDGYTKYTIRYNLEVTTSHDGQERTTTIEDKRIGRPDKTDAWGELLADYYGTMIRSIVATLENN